MRHRKTIIIIWNSPLLLNCEGDGAGIFCNCMGYATIGLLVRNLVPNLHVHTNQVSRIVSTIKQSKAQSNTINLRHYTLHAFSPLSSLLIYMPVLRIDPISITRRIMFLYVKREHTTEMAQ
jgi:hypothetical protein